jgi:hypothetical protein
VKLLNKYELMESLTTGKVETFVARDLVANERVLIHFFGGGEHLTMQPSQAWALQALRGIAPPPLGAFREGGRYEQTSYCYLVTNFPADARAVTNWVRIYKLHSETTRDLGPGIPETAFRQPIPKESAFSEPVGEITRAFLRASTADLGRDVQTTLGQDRDLEAGDLDFEAKERHGPGFRREVSLRSSASLPGAVAPAVDGKEGGQFTRLFGVGVDGISLPAAAPISPPQVPNASTESTQEKIASTSGVKAAAAIGSGSPSGLERQKPSSYGVGVMKLLLLIALALLLYLVLKH